MKEKRKVSQNDTSDDAIETDHEETVQSPAASTDGDYAFSRISQSTLITLRNAAADLKLETPWCVCRQCQGVGCRACGETGVQTKREYDLNPSKLKA